MIKRILLWILVLFQLIIILNISHAAIYETDLNLSGNLDLGFLNTSDFDCNGCVIDESLDYNPEEDAALACLSANYMLKYASSDVYDCSDIYTNNTHLILGIDNNAMQWSAYGSETGARINFKSANLHAGVENGTEWDQTNYASFGSGYHSRTACSYCSALGQSQSTAEYCNAIGNATCSGFEAIAMGLGSTNAGNSITIGALLTTGLSNSVGLGDCKISDGSYNVCMGIGAKVQADYDFVLSTDSTEATAASGATASILLGSDYQLNAPYSFVYGLASGSETISTPGTFIIYKANLTVDEDTFRANIGGQDVKLNTNSSASSNFTMMGDVRIVKDSEVAGNDYGRIELLSYDDHGEVKMYNQNILTIFLSGKNYSYFQGAGYIGIGETEPLGELHVDGIVEIPYETTGNITFRNSTGSHSAFIESTSTGLTFRAPNTRSVFKSEDLGGSYTFKHNNSGYAGSISGVGTFKIGDLLPEDITGILSSTRQEGDVYVQDDLEVTTLIIESNVQTGDITPNMYLTSATFTGGHGCDDDPSGCCDDYYHMCTLNEFKDGGRKIILNQDSYDKPYFQYGYVDPMANSTTLDCNDFDNSAASGDSIQCRINITGDPYCRAGSARGDCSGSVRVWCCSGE